MYFNYNAPLGPLLTCSIVRSIAEGFVRCIAHIKDWHVPYKATKHVAVGWYVVPHKNKMRP